MRLAVDNWQREVRNLHGERFMQWERAQEKTEECESASIGALGKLNQRCVISAIPCATLAGTPGGRQSLPVPVSRDSAATTRKDSAPALTFGVSTSRTLRSAL